MVNVVAAAIEHVLADYPVDADRVSLSGISNGGSATWELGIRRPDLFACVVPMAANGADRGRVDALKSVPVSTCRY